MNITKIINKCNYGPKYDVDNVDLYKNTKLSQSFDYIIGEDNICLNLQTIQNLFSGIESGGSSYKYTVTVPNIDNNIFGFFQKENEYFEKRTTIDYQYINKFFCVLCLFVVFVFLYQMAMF